jgi:hypothetical protein
MFTYRFQSNPRALKTMQIYVMRYFFKAASNPGSKFHSFGQQLRYFFGQQNYFFEQ